jgi:hypothetical protein
MMKKEEKGIVVKVSRCPCCHEDDEAEPIYTFTKGQARGGVNAPSVDVCSPFLKGALDLKGKFPRKIRIIFEEVT